MDRALHHQPLRCDNTALSDFSSSMSISSAYSYKQVLWRPVTNKPTLVVSSVGNHVVVWECISASIDVRSVHNARIMIRYDILVVGG